MINNILNGEDGLDVRDKLNALIDAWNAPGNGLKSVGTNIEVGGTLVGTLEWLGDGNDVYLGKQVASGLLGAFQVNAELGATLKVTDLTNEIALALHNVGQTISGNGNNNYMVVSDTFANKGLVAAADYSANFTPESYITKRYADALSASQTLAQILFNGNTVNNQYIQSNAGKSRIGLYDNQSVYVYQNGLVDAHLEFSDYYAQLSFYSGADGGVHTILNSGHYINHTLLNQFNAPSNVFNGALQATSTNLLSVLNVVNTYAQLSYDNGGIITDTFKTALSHGSLIEMIAPSITVSQEPTTALGIATKSYVDNAIAGLKFKMDVIIASPTNINVSAAPISIDGRAMGIGERFLLFNQTNATENGCYIYDGFGRPLLRANDSNTSIELISATYPIREGTYQDTWYTITNDTIVIGTTAINFTQTGGAGTYTYGNYLKLTGNVFDIDFSTFNSDAITEGSTNLFFTATRQALFVPFSGAGSDLDLNSRVLKNFYLSKTSDATAKMFFDLTALSTGATKTITYLNESGTVYLGNKTPQTLTDGATITWDVSQGQNANVTLGGNRTLAISNPVAGEYYTLRVIQDGTGSRTLTLPAGSKVVGGGAGAITLTTTAGAMDILTAYYNGTNYYWTYGTNFN